MANAPFSPFQGEFESLARQYWNTWNELLGRGQATPGWGGDPWSLMGGMPPGIGRMDPSAFEWFARIQQLSGQFGQGGRAADIAGAWRELLGGERANPFAGIMHGATAGLAGTGGWLDQVRPMLDWLLRPWRQQGAEWLQRPAFGPAREHQERLQGLALAWQEWEQRNEEFGALLLQAGQDAFVRFERLLEQHDAPGKRLESARALFDLWIDAAEEAWAEIALSEQYRHAYAAMTNALMRLRLGLQREVEQFGALLGLPGRSELDALHRKVAGLERALHAARRAGAGQDRASTPGDAAVTRTRRPAAPRPAEEPAPVAAEAAASPGAARAPSARRPARAAAPPKPRPTRDRKRAGAGKAAPRPAAARAPAAVRNGEREAPPAPGAGRATARTTRSAVATTQAKAGKPAARQVGKGAAAASAPAKKPALATRRPATGKPAAAKGGTSAKTPAKVVSIKDWVSRNLAPAAAPAAGTKAASTPARSAGKRGGRK